MAILPCTQYMWAVQREHAAPPVSCLSCKLPAGLSCAFAGHEAAFVHDYDAGLAAELSMPPPPHLPLWISLKSLLGT